MPLLRFLLVILLSSPLVVNAAQFYRWTDEDGNTFIQSYIPPEHVKNGYEIIDDQGNIVNKVAPQLSEAERRAGEAARISAEMQQARDNELLRLYRSPTDVDRAMKTWLSRMDMEVRVIQNRITIKETEFDTLQERAANQEKAGKEVDPELVSQMKTITLEIQGYGLNIREVELRHEESRASFMQDRDRMITLWEMINKRSWVEETETQ